MSLEKDKLALEAKILELHGFGAKQDPLDTRDFTPAMVGLPQLATFPEEYMLETKMPALDQGGVGSCVAHALATAYGYAKIHQGVTTEQIDYSRGFIYGNREDTDYQGEGMYPREALKNLQKVGDVLFTDFPYNETYPRVSARIKANESALKKLAKEHKIASYFTIVTQAEVKQALMETGGVIVMVPVFNDFNSDLQKPATNKEPIGWHEMCLVGWDKTGWIIQNSWGDSWGDHGLGHMMYDYPDCSWWSFYVVKDETKETKIKCPLIRLIISLIKKIFKAA